MHWSESITFDDSLSAPKKACWNGGNVGQAVKQVMCTIENENPDPAVVLQMKDQIVGSRTTAIGHLKAERSLQFNLCNGLLQSSLDAEYIAEPLRSNA